MTLRRSAAPLVWLLLAAALLARLAVPSGWMPAAGEHGISIALCSGSGASVLTLGKDGKLHRDAPTPVQPHDPCPFGLAAAQAADLPQPFQFAVPWLAVESGYARGHDHAAAALRRFPRPPARGPPLPA